MFPFVTLCTQSIFTCAWYITIEIRYVGYFSVAMIKHLDWRQIIEGRAYLSYSSVLMCLQQEAKRSHLLLQEWSRKSKQEVAWGFKLSKPMYPTVSFLQPGCTSPGASQQHRQLQTDFQCLNLWGISCSNYHIRHTNQGFTEKNIKDYFKTVLWQTYNFLTYKKKLANDLEILVSFHMKIKYQLSI